MKKISLASSYLTAPNALRPTIRLGNINLVAGESRFKVPPNTVSVDLSVSNLIIETHNVLDQCALGRNSQLAITIDLDCPGFDLTTTLYREVLDSEKPEAVFKDLLICSIPEPIISEGFAVKVSLIVTNPDRTKAVGCSSPGGVLSTWETQIPPRNMAIEFPVEASSDESCLWRLEILIDDPEDLDRPTSAALRLFVDTTRLQLLFGKDADQDTQDQAISWMRIEAGSAIVSHVLVNQSLREHFSIQLSRIPPNLNELDVRSVGYSLIELLSKTTGPQLEDWYERFTSDPVGTAREIRAKLGAIDNVHKGVQTSGSVES